MARVGLLLCLTAFLGRDVIADSGSAAPPAKPSVTSPRPVKQLTRAQLETEVQQLRIENAKLRSQLEAANQRERERIERLKEEQRKLNTKLRD